MVPETDPIKWMATLGVGGVLAAVVFFFYRKDVARYTEMWKGQSEALLVVVKENTEAVTQLITLVEALHHRLDADRNARRKEKRERTAMGRVYVDEAVDD